MKIVIFISFKSRAFPEMPRQLQKNVYTLIGDEARRLKGWGGTPC